MSSPWVIDPIGPLSGDTVQPDLYFEIGDPQQPGGSRDLLAEIYGRDLRFGEDFLLLAASGDLQRTTGLEALRASLTRAIVLEPGEIFWRPDYGIGLTNFLNLPASAANIHEMKNRISSTLASDPAVEEVFDPSVVVSRDGGLIEISVKVRIAGQEETIDVALRSLL